MAAPSIKIGGKAYDVPELTLYAMRRTAKIGAAIVRLQGQEQTDENIDKMFDSIVEIVRLWLGELYPELTPELIERSMTQSEMLGVTEAINPTMAASGIEQSGSGSAGNAQGAAGAEANLPKA